MRATQAWRHQGTDIAQDDVTQLQPVDAGAIALAQTVGGTQRHAETFFQLEALGQLHRNRHVGGAGVEHEVHRLAVDLAAGDKMPLRIADQLHLDKAFAFLRIHLGIGILLTLLPLGKKTRRQKQRRTPSQDHQHPAGALAWQLLAHGAALQPPSGAAKCQTIGRVSPSARAPSLLSRPTQAPSAFTTSASASP
ncbi:hypothetical protein D3C78_1383460 [compost metagenome]